MDVREDVERRLMSDRAELVGRRRDGAESPVEVTIAKPSLRHPGDVPNGRRPRLVKDASGHRSEESTMSTAHLHASTGDRIIVHGRNVGDLGRDGEVLGTGVGGAPPFTVRWSDNGHTSVFFPSAGVEVHHHGQVQTS